jgi:Carboxypeptidase regulatory-like domain/TonB dependent receptor
MHFVLHLTLAVFCVLALCQACYSQSTFGTVLGTIKDPSGSLIPMANVELMNTGTNALHSTLTNVNGTYEFVNVEIGTYKLSVAATGFQKTEYQAFEVAARATMRIDVDLKVASQATTVTVEAVAVVQTDASNIAETKGSLELTDLPVAIATRSSGSTSAYATLTAQPGVQIDNANSIQVAGAGPSQLSITVDGISSVGPGTLGALSEMFPSFNSIEEIKISETLNPAEFGGVADITTISKSGTNEFHGGVFENVQNTDFNAADTFSHVVALDKMNNFGIYLGGPVMFPKLYNGRNRTFFFGSFEVLRLPNTETYVNSVPTEALRNGDLSAYLAPSLGGSANLLTGFQNNQIPASELNPYSQKLMDLIYPLPNYGPPGAISNNFVGNYQIPIDSAQGDVRLDQNFGTKHSIYIRYSYKNRRITTPEGQSYYPSAPSTTLLGGVSRPEVYNSLAFSYNWVISPAVVNEFRAGFSLIHRNITFSPTAQQAASYLGLTAGPGALLENPQGDNLPTLSIYGFMGIQGQQEYLLPHEGTYEVTDNLTWTKGKHTFKFGADYRYLEALNAAVNTNYTMGDYLFDGSVMGAVLGNGAATPMASFLLGYPDVTTIGSVVNPNTYAWSSSYAVFAQDDFKVSQSLTLNYGLRWEYHPPFKDYYNNVANFDPNYSSTVDGQVVKGAVIYPNQQAFANLNPYFAGSIAPTPVILASQVGVSSYLRNVSKLDFAPRIGFAWRVFNNNKTVLRGGYGRFIESLLSGTAEAGWSMGSSEIGYFPQTFGTNGQPIYKMPYSYPSNIAQPGTEFFDDAVAIHYKDPIVEEWNLTLEQDLGKGVGLRISYDGNHGYNLPVAVNANQPAPNTAGYNAASTQAAIPFPFLGEIGTQDNLGFSNYNAGTISLKKRSVNLQFELSYTFARDLSNVNGAPFAPTAGFASEYGNILTDPQNPSLDYGNVPYIHRNRVLATFLYQLPFGRGQALLSGSGLLDRIVGGWQLGGVALFETGPYMSISVLSDPSGTGFTDWGNFSGLGGRADTVPGVSPYAGQSINQWINPAAFADPCANCQTSASGVTTAIGRFGDESAGSIVGPGTQAVSLSLLKQISIKERTRVVVGMQVANAFNHPNYSVPGNLTIGVPAFGTITSMQNTEGAGPRQIQLTGRLTF